MSRLFENGFELVEDSNFGLVSFLDSSKIQFRLTFEFLDFHELEHSFETKDYLSVDYLRKSGAIAVSIRGSVNVGLLLCERENYKSDFCYWIVFSGWNKKQQAIRKCPNGLPPLFACTETSVSNTVTSNFFTRSVPHRPRVSNCQLSLV